MEKAAASAGPAQSAKTSRQPDYIELVDRAHTGFTQVNAVIARKTSVIGPRGCIPVLWCLCVQDSPQNPCHCRDLMVWIPELWLKSARKTRHFNSSLGSRQPVVAIDLPSDTEIYIDDTIRCRADDAKSATAYRRGDDGELTPVEEEIWVPRFTPFAVGDLAEVVEILDGAPPSVVALKWSSLGHIWRAFSLGWKLGRAIAETFDTDDKISDWLLRVLGQWKGPTL